MRTFLLGAVLLLAGCGGGAGGDNAMAKAEPALETDPALLDAALDCTAFTHPDKEAVLLVHGTFTYGEEQWSWNYVPYLTGLGYDVCMVTYPDRGLIDQQISAEYVVNAVHRIYGLTGRKIGMVGHSQGGSMPRWAIKWWPSLQDMIEDFVMLAPVNHGTIIGGSGGTGLPTGMPQAFWQFAPDSHFVTAMNAGDETPGDISYTAIYTEFDELVEPQVPTSTSALTAGHPGAQITNILVQDVCPGRPVEHLSIGTTDAMVAALVVDALSHPGPADVTRAGGTALCTLTSIVDPATAAQKFAELGPKFFSSVPPSDDNSTSEPPLKPYATGG